MTDLNPVMRLALAAAICVVAVSTAAGGGAARASRPAEAGCHWMPLRSQALGVALLVQDCRDPDAHYVYSVVGNRIEQHRPADDRTYIGPRLLEMYAKPAEQGIEDAIAQRFIARLPPDARRSCRVVPYGAQRNTRLRYTLEPTGAYRKRIDAELARHPRDFGCGDYGRGQSDAYFEYHPAESRTRFAFVDAGQDAPLFDEESIRFLR